MSKRNRRRWTSSTNTSKATSRMQKKKEKSNRSAFANGTKSNKLKRISRKRKVSFRSLKLSVASSIRCAKQTSSSKTSWLVACGKSSHWASQTFSARDSIACSDATWLSLTHQLRSTRNAKGRHSSSGNSDRAKLWVARTPKSLTRS